MEIISKKALLAEYIDSERLKSKTIGFVPTMGALHEGHLDLIRWSTRECDVTICSIYVNPTQFNNPSDLKHYPRDIDDDIKKLDNVNCTALYMPDNFEMYGSQLSPETTMNFGHLETILEGAHRPGHFKGVGIVVSKLFNMVRPDYAYFGQKDLQQYAIVNQLINDLSFNIHLKCVPTKREPDGLAMSSRNRRLSVRDRETATFLYKALKLAEKKIGEKSPFPEIKKEIIEFLNGLPDFNLEYFELIDRNEFRIIEQIDENTNPAICIAADIHGIRLIDNLIII